MIRVAILGAGIGQKHLDGYLSLPDAYRVTTLCDMDTERAAALVGAHPIAVTASIDAVLADDSIDLVDICLPPHLHYPVAMDALAAGKHVVCEKPLVACLRDADALIAAARKADRLLAPVFQYRFGPAMSQLAALQQAGLTGAPHVASLETHWNRDAAYYAVPWRGTWAGENGGAVLGHAIHNHDLLACLLGPIARLSAFTTTRVNPIETEDCAAISFQMENGALATSSITLGAASDTTRLRVVFEHLTAESGSTPYAPATGTWTFTARDPARQPEVDATVAATGPVLAGFPGFFAELARALNGAPNSAVTPEDGRRSIELVAAIYQAARSGTIIDLPLTNAAPLYSGWTPQ